MVITHKNKGFTLIEILIASSIFALIMVIATSTFSWAVAYNGKLKEMRRVAENLRKASDDITNEARLANGTIDSVSIATNGMTHSYGGVLKIGEITFFDCSGEAILSCGLPLNLDSNNLTLSMKQPVRFVHFPRFTGGMLILQKSKKKIIFYRSIPEAVPYSDSENDEDDKYNYIFYKYTYEPDTWPTSFSLNDLSDSKLDEILNEGVISTKLKVSLKVEFGGFSPVRNYRNQQPYVEYRINAATWDHDVLKPNIRDKTEIRTIVETREYN